MLCMCNPSPCFLHQTNCCFYSKLLLQGSRNDITGEPTSLSSFQMNSLIVKFIIHKYFTYKFKLIDEITVVNKVNKLNNVVYLTLFLRSMTKSVSNFILLMSECSNTLLKCTASKFVAAAHIIVVV